MNPFKLITLCAVLALVAMPAFSQTEAEINAILDPAAAAAANFAPTRMIDMRPDEKRSLMLKPSERNPYARRAPEQETVSEEGENAEEIQIRERLNSLSVTGRSRGPQGLRILLGDIILEKGRMLPELIEDQSESLQVVEVNEESLVLSWLDAETGQPTGKTTQIAYDLSPRISYALQGQPDVDTESGVATQPRMGVLRIGQDRKKQEAIMSAKDPARVIPPEAYAAGN